MENFQKFDRYKKHLSSLGQQVLNVMLKQWKKECDVSQRRQHRTTMPPPTPVFSRIGYPRGRRILTFNPEPDVPPHSMPHYSFNSCMAAPVSDSVLTHSHCVQVDDTPFNFTALIEASPLPFDEPTIPTSTQLITPTADIVPKPDQRDVNYSRDDLINIPSENPMQLTSSHINKAAFERLLKIPQISSISKPEELDFGYQSNNVDWDNMFDSEILPEITMNNEYEQKQENLRKNKIKQKSITVGEDSQENNADQRNENGIKALSDILMAPEEMKKKAIKRRNDKNTKVKAAQKRLKITENKETVKVSYKKDNYNKTVQKWLSNVDPNNSEEEEDMKYDGPFKESIMEDDKGYKDIQELKCKPSDTLQAKNTKKMVQADKDTNSPDCKPSINIDKTIKTKNNKNVVQSKLANQGGIMKFQKPKESDQINVQEPETAPKVKDSTAKQKRAGKPKFVPPIKSQIPVKDDVTYDIVVVEDKNVNSLTKMTGTSVQMILLYSNGCCQLNSQHTDDPCVPEGVMIHAGDVFYYIMKSITLSNAVKDIIENILKNMEVICYEGKQLLIYLAEQYDIDLFAHEFRMMDSKIGGSLIDPDNPPEDFSQLQKVVSYTPSFAVATDCPRQKAAWYCGRLRELAGRLREVLEQEQLWELYVNIEVPLVSIISDMEHRGVLVDTDALKSMEDILLEKMKVVEQQCYQAAGRSFQINSTLQVRAILYDELKLDSKCNIKIRETITTGAKSTSEMMLKSLISLHSLPKLILEYRHLHKAHATFVIGILQHVKDGVVRPSWVQTAAATGRIASNNPNLQAIPKDPFSLELYPEPGTDVPRQLQFRSVYAARAGCALLAADFRHVECRVFAHAAADQRLRDALRAPDLFRELAASWLRKPLPAVTAADRERTKRVVYAGLYGAGARRLADILQLSYGDALDVAASFNSTFPSLRSFGRGAVSRCAAAGGRLRTGAGRARRLPDIASRDAASRARAERQAVNFLVQGSAADVCKAAMVAAVRALRCPRPPNPPSSPAARPPSHARLLLQIHDELVWEVRQEDLAEAAAIVRAAMQACGAAAGLAALALPVALRAGAAWGQLEPYQ